MKRWSTSLAAREIQIKATRYLYTSRIGSVPQIHPPFLQQSALCVSGKWRVGGITKYSHSILPGRRVCSEPVFAQSRGPLGCHRVCKASFCGLKKITTNYGTSFLISDKETRDQRPQGSYPKPHSSDPDSSAHPLVDVVGARLGAGPGPIVFLILNPQAESRELVGPVSCLQWPTGP